MGRLVESQTSVLLYLRSVRVSLHQKLHIHKETKNENPIFKGLSLLGLLNDTWNNYHVSLTAQLFPSANSLPIYPICKDSIVTKADQNWLPQSQARLAEGSHQCPDLLSLDSKFFIFLLLQFCECHWEDPISKKTYPQNRNTRDQHTWSSGMFERAKTIGIPKARLFYSNMNTVLLWFWNMENVKWNTPDI